MINIFHESRIAGALFRSIRWGLMISWYSVEKTGSGSVPDARPSPTKSFCGILLKFFGVLSQLTPHLLILFGDSFPSFFDSLEHPLIRSQVSLPSSFSILRRLLLWILVWSTYDGVLRSTVYITLDSDIFSPEIGWIFVNLIQTMSDFLLLSHFESSLGPQDELFGSLLEPLPNETFVSGRSGVFVGHNWRIKEKERTTISKSWKRKFVALKLTKRSADENEWNDMNRDLHLDTWKSLKYRIGWSWCWLTGMRADIETEVRFPPSFIRTSRQSAIRRNERQEGWSSASLRGEEKGILFIGWSCWWWRIKKNLSNHRPLQRLRGTNGPYHWLLWLCIVKTVMHPRHVSPPFPPRHPPSSTNTFIMYEDDDCPLEPQWLKWNQSRGEPIEGSINRHYTKVCCRQDTTFHSNRLIANNSRNQYLE